MAGVRQVANTARELVWPALITPADTVRFRNPAAVPETAAAAVPSKAVLATAAIATPLPV